MTLQASKSVQIVAFTLQKKIHFKYSFPENELNLVNVCGLVCRRTNGAQSCHLVRSVDGALRKTGYCFVCTLRQRQTQSVGIVIIYKPIDARRTAQQLARKWTYTQYFM